MRIPCLVENILALFGRAIVRRERGVIHQRNAIGFQHLLPPLRVIGLPVLFERRVERLVARWHAERGRALKHGEVRGLLRNDRHRLNTGGAGADEADALPGKVHAFARPVGGVIDRSLELVPARPWRRVRHRKRARCRNHITAGHHIALGGAHVPAVGFRIELQALHRVGQTDGIAQAKAVGHVVGIAFKIGLGGKLLRPVPFLLEFIVEAIGIFDALDINPRAGVAVPVPRAADAIARFKAHDLVIIAQTPDRVKAGEPRPDHDNVGLFHLCLVHIPSQFVFGHSCRWLADQAAGGSASAITVTLPSSPTCSVSIEVTRLTVSTIHQRPSWRR